MSFQAVREFLIPVCHAHGAPAYHTVDDSTRTIDAANEYVALVGQVLLTSGPGTTKTLDNTGKIWAETQVVTWADAGTNLRIGVQDLDSSEYPDGTFDVYGDFVPGTDSLGNFERKAFAMETGSKNINHGQPIAIVFQLTARGGSDAVKMRGSITEAPGWPIEAFDTGGGASKTATRPLVALIEFGDGTMGYFQGQVLCSVTSVTYNSGSTPDEYGLYFESPTPFQLGGVRIGDMVGGAGAYEVILYTDPLGTPAATVLATVDYGGGDIWVSFASAVDIAAATPYVLAIRPTTVTNVRIAYQTFGSGNEELLRPNFFGEDGCMASRTNNAGAFTRTTHQVPLLQLVVVGMELGSGGGSSYPRGRGT